jgi:hypothetical protein
MIEERVPAGLSEEVVARKVAEYLKDCHPDGISLEVEPEGVRWERFWWQVRVRPSEEPAKLSNFYRALASVEMALEEREHLKVFLTPGEPKQSPVVASVDTPAPLHDEPKRQSRLTKQAVAEKVEEYLRDCHPGGITLRVDTKHLRKQNRVWKIPVQPDMEPPKLLEYYEALADIEMALVEREHLDVWLVTVDPPQPVDDRLRATEAGH